VNAISWIMETNQKSTTSSNYGTGEIKLKCEVMNRKV